MIQKILISLILISFADFANAKVSYCWSIWTIAVSIKIFLLENVFQKNLPAATNCQMQRALKGQSQYIYVWGKKIFKKDTLYTIKTPSDKFVLLMAIIIISYLSYLNKNIDPGEIYISIWLTILNGKSKLRKLNNKLKQRC